MIICKKHNWQKYHPDEDCLVCYYVGLKKQVLNKYPHYVHQDQKLDEAINRVHLGRSL
jgi:hypothetical protein